MMFFFLVLFLFFWLFVQVGILGRVVKALDLSSNGRSPREFEPRRMHIFFVFFFLLFRLIWRAGV